MKKILCENVSNAFKELRSYFKKDRDEIITKNIRVLRLSAYGATLLTMIFVLVAQFLLPNWHVTYAHIGLCLASLVYGIVIDFIIHKKIQVSYGIQIFLVSLFNTILMWSFILIDTIYSQSNSQQIFVSLFLIVLPAVFVFPFRVMLVGQSLFLGSFIAMSYLFKTPETFQHDVFASTLGFLTGIVVFLIIMNLRISDYKQKINYKISSEIDSLTHIYNRAACKHRIEKYLQKNDKYNCAMIIIDVDDFKEVNDILGHDKGDVALQEISQILLSEFRDNDIVGRFGGDEFVAFLKDISNKASVEERCNHINKRLSCVLDGKFNISCSMGICLLIEDSANTEEMFHIADEALYEAKTFKKGSFVVHNYQHNIKEKDRLPLMMIIDSDSVEREIIGVQFEDKFRLEKFGDSPKALDYIYENCDEIAIILLDMESKNINGFEVIKTLKSTKSTTLIPIIAMAMESSIEESALKCGAIDIINKPIVPAIAKFRVSNVVKKLRN